MKKCQPRHPDATLGGTPLEMSHDRLTWYWDDKHCEGPAFIEAKECQRNVAFYRLKCFVEKAIGKETALTRLPSLLWPSASRSRNEKKCLNLHVQRCPESFNETDTKWRKVISPLMLLTVDLQTYDVLKPTTATTALAISTLAIPSYAGKGPTHQERTPDLGERLNFQCGWAISSERKNHWEGHKAWAHEQVHLCLRQGQEWKIAVAEGWRCVPSGKWVLISPSWQQIQGDAN